LQEPLVTDLQNSVEKPRVLRSMRDLRRIFGELIAYAMLFIAPRDTAAGVFLSVELWPKP
jgi:hypothetical protein